MLEKHPAVRFGLPAVAIVGCTLLFLFGTSYFGSLYAYIAIGVILLVNFELDQKWGSIYIKNIHQRSRWMFANAAYFYLNSFEAAFIEDERKVIFLIGILSLRSS